jgi:cytochrome c oxidase subunit 2
MRTRNALRIACAVALTACGGGQDDAGDVPVVKILAAQWAFTPSTVDLKKNETIEFDLTSQDVHHRFYVPDFGIDEDIVPDQTTKVRFTPNQSGTFHFRCEYYCGQGHEGMVGHLVIQ